MISMDEEAVLCDLAETYHIYDIKSLPLSKVAIYAVGLRDDSRIKMKIQGTKYAYDTLLSAAMVDRLSLLLWLNTNDAVSGVNKPKSIISTLLGVAEENEVIGYSTTDEFEIAWKGITRKGGA